MAVTRGSTGAGGNGESDGEETSANRKREGMAAARKAKLKQVKGPGQGSTKKKHLAGMVAARRAGRAAGDEVLQHQAEEARQQENMQGYLEGNLKHKQGQTFTYEEVCRLRSQVTHSSNYMVLSLRLL